MALDQRKTAYGYYEKALAYREAGDFISALNEIKLAISYDPYNNAYKDERKEIERSLDPAALSEKILANIRSGNFAVALKCAESLACQYPDKRSTLSEKASEASKSDAGKQPFPSFLVPSAEGYAREKNFGFAIKLVAEAIALDPNNKSLARQLEELGNAKEWYVHISSHGKCWDFSDGKITTICTQDNLITAEDIEGLWTGLNDLGPYLVFMSACEVGRVDLIKAFNDAGVECIAPLNPVSWEDAAVFISLFYYFLFVEYRSSWVSFRNAKKLLPSKKGGWAFWHDGKRKTH